MLHRVADRQNLPYFCSKELHVGESLPAVPLSTLKVSFMPGTGKLDGAIPTPTAHQLDSFLYSVEPPSVALDAGNSGQQLLSQVTTVVPHATRRKVAGSTRSQEGCLGNIGKGAKQHSQRGLVMHQREQLVLQRGKAGGFHPSVLRKSTCKQTGVGLRSRPRDPFRHRTRKAGCGRPAPSVRKVPSRFRARDWFTVTRTCGTLNHLPIPNCCWIRPKRFLLSGVTS